MTMRPFWCLAPLALVAAVGCGEGDEETPDTLADELAQRRSFVNILQIPGPIYSDCSECQEIWSYIFERQGDGTRTTQFTVYTRADANSPVVEFCTESANETFTAIPNFDPRDRMLVSDTYTATNCPGSSVGITVDQVVAAMRGDPFAIALWQPASAPADATGLTIIGTVEVDDPTQIAGAYLACDDEDADFCEPQCPFGVPDTCQWTTTP